IEPRPMQPLRPIDHDVFESGMLRLERLDALDDVRGRSAEPRLLRDPVGKIRYTRRRARCAPGAAMLVGVADEAERREPLVTLVVRGLNAALRLRGRVGK